MDSKIKIHYKTIDWLITITTTTIFYILLYLKTKN